MGELRHHGIKGMRWGRRRFQNTDGTLTPVGKKRYDVEVKNGPYGKFKTKESQLDDKQSIITVGKSLIDKILNDKKK